MAFRDVHTCTGWAGQKAPEWVLHPWQACSRESNFNFSRRVSAVVPSTLSAHFSLVCVSRLLPPPPLPLEKEG